MESDKPNIIDAKHKVVSTTVVPLSPVEARRAERRAELLVDAEKGDTLAAALLESDDAGKINLGSIRLKPLVSLRQQTPLKPLVSAETRRTPIKPLIPAETRRRRILPH